jgi:ATP-dependent DNA helicase RecQ
MDDQVEGLRQQGVAAGALHSALSPEEASATWAALSRGTLKLLYISPERLLSGDGLRLLAGLPLALFAIDEAHCLSQWGHDFRPDYLQLGQLAERFPDVPRLALTATADPRTRDDIRRHLRLPPEAVFVASFNRANIRYWVRPKEEPSRQLLAFLAEHRGEAGIVYARSRKRVEQVAALLQGQGIDAEAYHAGLDPERRTAVLLQSMRCTGACTTSPRPAASRCRPRGPSRRSARARPGSASRRSSSSASSASRTAR